MKAKRLMVGLVTVGSLALAIGCVERRVVYVPANPPPPAYAYSTPPAAPPVPATAQPGEVQGVSSLPPAGVAPTPQPAVTVVAPAAPPTAQVEVMPVAPGPEYYWTPGYWGWNGAVWVWVGGRWAPHPWHGAVWVGGHWARHGHGYVWVGGHWR